MDLHHLLTVFPAAAVATSIALAAFWLGVLEARATRARGSTPAWAYASALGVIGIVALALRAGWPSAFAFNLVSILLGMVVGGGLSYYGFRAAFRLLGWWRRA